MVEGLGGSYGQETLTKYFMKDEMGVPVIEKKLYPKEDNSWSKEMDMFLSEKPSKIRGMYN